MPVVHLKQATKTPETETGNARRVAAEMLAKIERGGEQAVRDYAAKLDQWTGDIVVTDEEVERRIHDIAPGVKRDIEFATDRVRRFAQAQRESICEFSMEIDPGRRAMKRVRSLLNDRTSACFPSSGSVPA